MSDVLFGVRNEGAFALEFGNVIAPQLATLDATRRANLKLFLIIAAGAALAAVLIATLMWISGAAILPILIFTAVPLVIGWYASAYPARVYREAVLAAVMPPVCKFIGGISYARVPTQGIAPEPLASLGLLPEHDRVSQEDEFHGSYRSTAFRMVDMTLKRRTGTGKRRKVRTVFQGLVLQLAVPARFDCRVLIGREPSMLARPFANREAALRGLTLVEFDDAAFEEMFRVYTDNPDGARMLLTQTVRATLMAFVNEHHKAGLKAAFADGQFTCAAASGPLFEPGSLFRSASKLEPDVRRLLRDATIPHRLIDNLHGAATGPVVQLQR